LKTQTVLTLECYNSKHLNRYRSHTIVCSVHLNSVLEDYWIIGSNDDVLCYHIINALKSCFNKNLKCVTI